MDEITRFDKANGYIEFPLKKMAIDFLLNLPDATEAQLFAKDKINSDTPGAQTFIVSHTKRIYRMSVYALIEGKPLSVYEWMGTSMKKKDTTVKNTIDMDMEGVPKSRPFNEDIVWVVSFVSAAIERHYKVIVARDQWVVLKCDFDDVKQKYSAHLILHGFVWPDVKARKRFMESIDLVQQFAERCPEAKTPHRIIDASVFDSKMLRLYKSTKAGKNLPLWGATVDGCMPPEESFDYFRKSMGTYTANCLLLEEPVEAIPVPSPSPRPVADTSRGSVSSTPSLVRKLTSTADKDRYAPPFSVLERLVLALDQNKRVGKGSHDNWIRLGWAITNIGRAGGYEQAAKTLFDVISKPHNDAYDDTILNRLVDNARTDSNRIGWPYLKSCLLEDDPERYKEIFDTSVKVNMDIASSSQVAIANGTQVENIAIVNYVEGSKTIKELVNFCANFNEMKTHLEGVLGFRNVCLLQEREAGFNFDADKHCMCPLCTVSNHNGNAYFCIQVMPRVFVVRNYASGCKQHIVGWEENGPLDKLLLTPDSDAPYVDLFEAHFKRRLKWTGKHFLFFKDHLWRPIPTEDVYNTISKMANLILDRLLDSLSQTKKELDVQDGDKELKKTAKERYQAALRGLKYIKRNSNVRGMVEMTKNRLIADVDEVLDTNPFLLGTENGILDLKTGHLRIGVPEDNISKSVGYSFFDDSNKHEQTVQDAFDDFLRRIYPVDEEREVVQRFCGYALLGSHPEKKMCLFTDARGGYNGKSSMCKALMGALGSSYAHKPKPELLYKPDFSSGTIDSHSSGMLNFRGVRLAIVEELDEKKQLNNALIKDLNGGNSTFEGRACKSAETVAFPWITKMVLAFNNQRMPNFDFTDPALLNRFLIIQHRSRFCTEEDDYDTNKDVPYTFVANSDLDQLLVEWKPYMLKWCLKGLQNYFSIGFRRFPASCEEWKKAFVAQRDLVAAFVGDYLEKTSDQTVCLTRAELYSTYSKHTPEEQKSKTQLGKGRFFEALKKTLGETDLRLRHNNHRDCFVGWKFRSLENETQTLYVD